MKKVVILDNGFGNISATKNFLSKDDQLSLRIESGLTSISPDEILVLSGVGNYGTAIGLLEHQTSLEKINNHYAAGGKILGICLGLQLFLESSDEDPNVNGLGFITGRVRSNTNRKSFIGWSELISNKGKDVTADRNRFYFSHTYHVEPENKSIIEATCGVTGYAAILKTETLLGIQFHPEKSQSSGLRILHSMISPFIRGLN